MNININDIEYDVEIIRNKKQSYEMYDCFFMPLAGLEPARWEIA